MFIITVVEKGPQKKKIEEDSDKDELNDLKIERKQNSTEEKINDESNVIELKNLRFSNFEKHH